MGMRLHHTIVPAHDGERSARWFADMLGLSEPIQVSHFWQVATDNGVDLDFDTYADDDGPFTLQHYAFTVDERTFDDALARIRERAVPHWADPRRTQPGEINHRYGGRGVYFASNDDHLLEIINRPSDG